MCELILLVGIPASGKSTFREKFFPEAAVVNPDSFIGYVKENPWTPTSSMIAWKKSDELLFEYIVEGKEKIIFDATFITPKRRKKYIKIAKQNDIKVLRHFVKNNIELYKALLNNQYV
jgi:predicted kinase